MPHLREKQSLPAPGNCTKSSKATGERPTAGPQPRKAAPGKNRTNRGCGGCWKGRRAKDKKIKGQNNKR